MAPPTLRAQLVISCTPNCTVEYEPPAGQPVSLLVRGDTTEHVELLIATETTWASCQLPCNIDWPGTAHVRVRAGTGDRALTFGVDAVSQGAVVLHTIAGGNESLADALRAAGFDVPFGERIDKLVGDVAEIPSRIEATIVGSDAVVVERGRGSSVSESLDRYYDDVVAIEGGGISCTAIVVGEHWLLTARHCRAARSAKVVGSNGRIADVEIKEVEVYPDAATDIALLAVETSLQVPVRARASQLSDRSQLGIVKFVGFGTNERTGQRGYGVKRQAIVSVDRWECSANRAARTGCRPSSELVISSTSDTCAGDSGGPVLEQVSDGWRLVGITSRAIPGTGSVCGGGGIYTSVAAIDDWLDERMKHR